MRRILKEAEDRNAAEGTPAPLTDDQLAAMHESEDPAAVGATLGVDTTGWEQLNPPEDVTTPTMMVGPEADVSKSEDDSSEKDAVTTTMRRASEKRQRRPAPTSGTPSTSGGVQENPQRQTDLDQSRGEPQA
jgi:hypothetical protein